jgi:hypothetical protein
MAKKVVDHLVVVSRKNEKSGKFESVSVPAGTAFSFTADELADIERHQPGSTRAPKNEDPDAPELEAPAETPAQTKARLAAEAKAEAEAKAAAGKGNDL